MDIKPCKCGSTPIERTGCFDYEDVYPCSVYCPECGNTVSINPNYDEWVEIERTMEDVIERWNKGEYDED
jgi:hypothetical protein